MGLSLSPATHAAVPDDVKQKVEPIAYAPAPAADRARGGRCCPCCDEPFFPLFTPRTNCDWCGGEFCANCCPARHLLGGMPGCPACTQRAFRAKRQEMLDEHVSRAAYKAPARIEFT